MVRHGYFRYSILRGQIMQLFPTLVVLVMGICPYLHVCLQFRKKHENYVCNMYYIRFIYSPAVGETYFRPKVQLDYIRSYLAVYY